MLPTEHDNILFPTLHLGQRSSLGSAPRALTKNTKAPGQILRPKADLESNANYKESSPGLLARYMP
jgi:hypothetical protein